ncbi:dUTP diphosphatase [Nitrosophilus kaiyonis]|uniref:dUTP diphosphatase n=1 Tax=Nitrosophilus kaiyonis TaxID=2930200 RepID=UPI002490BC52|nr:dUTP diphosphatase [Nitrosophilus kaiyonis]
MKEKILEMLQLQNELNSDTNGPNWREDITKNGKIINWKRCIYMESAELIDSFPWKHWKNIEADLDIENIKIELVDIWHFIMSYLLKFHSPLELTNLIDNLKDSKSDIHIPKKWEFEDNKKINEYLDIFEELMALALIKNDSEPYQESLLETFFKACDSVGLNFDDLYKLYIGKNVLNKFRQDHGYKEGNYKKIWNNKEDNVIMQEILYKNEDIDFNSLYNELENIYSKTVQND